MRYKNISCKTSSCDTVKPKTGSRISVTGANRQCMTQVPDMVNPIVSNNFCMEINLTRFQ